MDQLEKSLSVSGWKKCDICDGKYPLQKHNFEECYSLDFKWDLEQMVHYNSYMMDLVNCAWSAYVTYGSRSSKKVNIIHDGVSEYINNHTPHEYVCKTEQTVSCLNGAGKKRCDICVYKNNDLVLIVPVKFVCSNFKQNKNNYLENLVGETYLLKQKNRILVTPLNIFIHNTRYLNKDGSVKNVETVSISDTVVYNNVPIFDAVYNIIVEVNYETNKVKYKEGSTGILFKLIQLIV